MKRYVKEFAADRIKLLEYAREDIKQKAIERINKIVNRCERGFITNLEAVQQIIKAIEEVWRYEQYFNNATVTDC